MKRRIACAVTLIAVLSMALGPWGVTNSVQSAEAQSVPCGLVNPAFCDTFDQPFNGGGRTGQLDPARWTVSRVSGTNNPGQGLMNEWIPSVAMHCKDRVTGVLPDKDYFMCGPEVGESMHFMEAFDDNHTYQYNSARIRQPFDFANRTGTITFEVDAKTAGSHGWWVEAWVTDTPISAPHGDSDPAFSQNGVAVRFHNPCWQGPPAGEDGAPQTTLGEVDVIRNFQLETAPPWGDPSSTGLIARAPNCIDAMPDMRNRFEIRMNQNHLEVWATDAMGTTLKQIGVVDGLHLGFTRGYVHLQHAQYNASKAAEGVVDYQTYHWDNVGFDGPVLPVPAQYGIPDALTPGADNGAVNLGYLATANGFQNGPRTFTGVNLVGANSATLALNEWARGTLKYRFNGGPWHSWTGPDEGTFGGANTRAMTVPVSLSELQNGNNTLDVATLSDVSVISNIDLVLSGAAAPVPSSAPATNTPVTAVTPTATVVPPMPPTPTTTPVPTSTPGLGATATAVPTVTSTAVPTASTRPPWRHRKPTPTPTNVP